MRRRDFLRTAVVGAGTTWLGGKLTTPLSQQRKLGCGARGTRLAQHQPDRARRCRRPGIASWPPMVTGTPEKAATWKWHEKYGLRDGQAFTATLRCCDKVIDDPAIDAPCYVVPAQSDARRSFTIAGGVCRQARVVRESRWKCSTAQECRRHDCRVRGGGAAAGDRLTAASSSRTTWSASVWPASRCWARCITSRPDSGSAIGDPARWRRRKALAGGGPLMDVGVYALQAARLVTSEEPTSVSATETKTDSRKFSEVEEAMRFELRFPGGVVRNDVRRKWTQPVPGAYRPSVVRHESGPSTLPGTARRAAMACRYVSMKSTSLRQR